MRIEPNLSLNTKCSGRNFWFWPLIIEVGTDELIKGLFRAGQVDCSGYGDSGTNVQMLEHGMVNDHLQIYDWILAKNFTKNIYYWGHSLGGALSCHLVRALKERNNAVPKGLILESTFTTLVDAIENNVVGKVHFRLPNSHLKRKILCGFRYTVGWRISMQLF